MRSGGGANGSDGYAVAGVLTTGEISFRNTKLGSAWLVAYKAFADILGKGSLFVITLVAARRLSPWSFGVFALGSTLGWMLSTAADFGMQMHVARAVARTPGDAPHVLRRWLAIRLWTTTGLLTAMAAALAWAGGAFVVPLLLFAVLYAASGLVEFLNYFYRGLSRTDVESSLTLWQRGAMLACALIALAWRPDINALAIAMLTPVLATLAWSLRFAMRVQGTRAARQSRSGPGWVTEAASSDDRGPTSTGYHDSFLGDVFPIGLGLVLSALYFRVDVLLVECWVGTEAVARYNAVFRLIEAMRLFPAAVLAVVLPSLCRAGDLRPLARVSATVTAFAALAAVALWTSAGWLVPLTYGPQYESAVPVFRVLVLSFPLLSLNFALTHQLVAWNRQRAYAVVCGLALALNLALNAWLIPALSIEGAAWATLGTELFLTLGCLVALP